MKRNKGNRGTKTENSGDRKGPEKTKKVNPAESGTQGGFGQGNAINKGSEGPQGYGV